jgi:hypothetical protein
LPPRRAAFLCPVHRFKVPGRFRRRLSMTCICVGPSVVLVVVLVLDEMDFDDEIEDVYGRLHARFMGTIRDKKIDRTLF